MSAPAAGRPPSAGISLYRCSASWAGAARYAGRDDRAGLRDGGSRLDLLTEGTSRVFFGEVVGLPWQTIFTGAAATAYP